MSSSESEIAMYDNDEDCALSPPVLRLSKMFENCMSPHCDANNSRVSSRRNLSNCESSPEHMDSSRTPPGGYRTTPSVLLGTPFAASLWDSGLGSPSTPVASSTMAPGASRRPAFRSSGLMPIPFAYDERDETEEGTTGDPDCVAAVPTTPPTEPVRRSPVDDVEKFHAPLATPLGRSMNSLNISQTPRSLIQRRAAQKSLEKAHRLKALSTRDRRSVSGRRRPGLLRPSADPEGPQVNINPFLATSIGLNNSAYKKNTSSTPCSASCDSTKLNPISRCLDTSDMTSLMDVLDDSGIDRSAVKLSLRQINTARFDEEFYIMRTIGNGQFGVVFKCINRIDGCVYAVKKSRFPVAGNAYERNALNEVYAHAVLGKHPNIVGYYSAWAEEDRVFIQTEYCNGGSLSALLADTRQQGRKHLSEPELKQLTVHVAAGLKYIHSHGLVHLDVKPDNIFIQRLRPAVTTTTAIDGSMDEGLGEDTIEELDCVVYKVGDLGQVTASKSRSVDEGDCRYLPAELLADKFDDLPRADVFSLALTVFEAATGQTLPPNGPLWHEYRQQGLPDVQHLSTDFNSLIKLMASYEVKRRPTAHDVTQCAGLSPFTQKSSTQLRREWTDERVKNEALTRQLDDTRRALQQLQQSLLAGTTPTTSQLATTTSASGTGTTTAGNRTQRMVGRTCGRSRSLITF